MGRYIIINLISPFHLGFFSKLAYGSGSISLAEAFKMPSKLSFFPKFYIPVFDSYCRYTNISRVGKNPGFFKKNPAQ
jgi:hypothetical protein